MQPSLTLMRRTVALALLGASSLLASPLDLLKKHPAKTPEQLRMEYIARLQARNVLGDFSSDYKARNLNDTITIQVAVQTTAAQSGTVDSERSFTSSSAITGIMGRVPAATNPLLSGNSSSVLKGQGSTASNTTFSTNLTGQVIAVFPNGNLVVQAERQIFMNNQHENVIVRGMIRPGDIGPGNIVPSAALSNLEIEMKGKGIIADGVRPPNAITRAVLWLLNF
jgi:flagellar L-ring protein precursor FlgH